MSLEELRGLEVSLREGMEVRPLEGDDTIRWMLAIVNDLSRSESERVGAFLMLLQRQLSIRVSIEGDQDG